MITMPIFKHRSCLADVLAHFSKRISGRIPTRAIYKKPPLVKGNIQLVKFPACSALLNDKANIAPDTPAVAVSS